ncbi:glycosyltransferase [Jatrophihabitans sp. YIM 134969]
MLWLSPWLRGLARVQVDALAARGVETLLITSDQHPETRGAARPDEIVVRPSPKRPASWPEFRQAWQQARQFAPDVVVAELVRDPRWSVFARLAPVVHAVHDDEPHDVSERPPPWTRAVEGTWQRSAAQTVVFSEYVADVMAVRGVEATVVPLTSDLPDTAVPELVPADRRRDVVLVGRLLPYKNAPVAFAAWERHRTGPAFRGDRLVLVGGGDPGPLPAGVVHREGTYRYDDVVPTLAAAKASLVHYRHASQSGTQLLAMQLGVAPIASPRGALFTTQPPDAPVVDVDDVDGLVAALDRLADPLVAAEVGTAARRHYRDHHAVDHAAAAWLEVLSRAAG